MDKRAVIQLTTNATVEERENLRNLLEANGYDTDINLAGGEVILSRPEDD